MVDISSLAHARFFALQLWFVTFRYFFYPDQWARQLVNSKCLFSREEKALCKLKGVSRCFPSLFIPYKPQRHASCLKP